MCVTAGDTCTAWADYQPTTSVTLDRQDGLQTVTVHLRDVHGNESSAQAAVALDRDAPEDGTLSVEVDTDGVHASWTAATASGSGVAEYVLIHSPDRAPSDCGSGTEVYRGPHTEAVVSHLSTGHHGFRACAVDALGHVSSGDNARALVQSDYAAPSISQVQINGGAAHTWSRQVTFTVDATDASQIAQMCISETPECGLWRGFYSPRDVRLDETAGRATEARTLYVWLRDSEGNETETPAQATIEYTPDIDLDGDGYTASEDCDDDDASVHLGNGTCPLGINCADILDRGVADTDGEYLIDPDGYDSGLAPFVAYCDMTTDGGGWTEVPYTQDFPVQNWKDTGDRWYVVPFEFEITLDDAQVAALQAVAEEGYQQYVGLCTGVVHYVYARSGGHSNAVGFLFADGTSSPRDQQSYAPYDIEVVQEGCQTNGGEGGLVETATIYEIHSVSVPVVGIDCRDCGNPSERLGSPLTEHSAWLR